MLFLHARSGFELDGCRGPYAAYCSCLLAQECQMRERSRGVLSGLRCQNVPLGFNSGLDLCV